MKKTLREKIFILKTKYEDLKVQYESLDEELNERTEENKSLIVEKTNLKNLLVVNDLEKDKKDLKTDLDHSKEVNQLLREIIELHKDRPKEVKVEVQPAGVGYTLNGSGLTTSNSNSATATGTSTSTTMTGGSYGY